MAWEQDDAAELLGAAVAEASQDAHVGALRNEFEQRYRNDE